jgi:sulfur carrier protein
MQLFVNQDPVQTRDGIFVSELLVQLEQSSDGVALAVGDCVIPKNQWSSYLLHEGDVVSLFRAIAGG